MAEFLDRLGRVVRAEMLSEALSEDPEKAIEQALSEMQQCLDQLRLSIFRLNKNRSQLELQLKQAQAEAANWQQQADLATAQGNEYLAMEALQCRQNWLVTAAKLASQLKQTSSNIESLIYQQSEWQIKLDQAQTKKRSLIRRLDKVIIDSEKNVTERRSTAGAVDFYSKEENLLRTETFGAAVDPEGRNLEVVPVTLDSGSDVDEELAAMRKNLLNEISATKTSGDNDNSSYFSKEDELEKLKEKLDQL